MTQFRDEQIWIHFERVLNAFWVDLIELNFPFSLLESILNFEDKENVLWW